MVERDELADELAEHLAGDYEFAAIEDEGQQLAPIEDDAQVDRMLRRRHRLLTERGRISDVASAEVRRIREWEQDRTAGIDQQAAWVDRGLEQYARQVLPARRIKSLSLPNGTLKLTQPGSPSVVVVDEGEFTTWCLLDDARDAFLRRTVAPEKAELRRRVKAGPEDDDRDDGGDDRWFFAVDEDGEVVPGIRLAQPALPRFSVAMPKAEPPTVTPPDHDVQDTRTEENAE